MKQSYCALILMCGVSLRAQMPGMDHSGMKMGTTNAAETFLMKEASGTAVNPAAWPMPMSMHRLGSWNTMFMGVGFLMDTQQSGPRGGDKLYSTNWFMAAAQHRVGPNGAFQMDIMLSLEPATVTQRRYPLLLQTGETAFGQPIVDGQHPHNFIMALGFHYARQLGENTTLEAYFAPVGDPALGPVSFPHRASAMELPQAPLSHHWQDATHIADEVVTVGLAYKKIKLEASGFHGSEPGENRWIIQGGPMNSWSARLWFFPNPNWAMQVSTGRLARPERLEPGDQVRTTASIAYSRPMAGSSWSSSLIWGRNHSTGHDSTGHDSTATKHDLNSYLAESVLPFGHGNFVTGRMELVDKDELVPGGTFRVGEYTVGYTRDIGVFHSIETGIGANLTFYSLPTAIKPIYGDHPVGGSLFLRLRWKPPAS